MLIRGTFLEGLTLAIRSFMSCTSFSYVLLRLSIVLHDGLAAPGIVLEELYSMH